MVLRSCPDSALLRESCPGWTPRCATGQRSV